MRAIWKYAIPDPIGGPSGIYGKFTLEMPKGAVVLTVAVQEARPTIWVEVETAAGQEPLEFFVVGTGKEFPPFVGRFVGTFNIGAFVWHLYEMDADFEVKE